MQTIAFLCQIDGSRDSLNLIPQWLNVLASCNTFTMKPCLCCIGSSTFKFLKNGGFAWRRNCPLKEMGRKNIRKWKCLKSEWHELLNRTGPRIKQQHLPLPYKLLTLTWIQHSSNPKYLIPQRWNVLSRMIARKHSISWTFPSAIASFLKRFNLHVKILSFFSVLFFLFSFLFCKR